MPLAPLAPKRASSTTRKVKSTGKIKSAPRPCRRRREFTVERSTIVTTARSCPTTETGGTPNSLTRAP
jgi:hypothetical protein